MDPLAPIWDACQGPQLISPLSGVVLRLVESQEQIATLSFVDTLEEQALLEELLESAKPPGLPEGPALHYLLRTPFRYPPLKWGSRYGRCHEPSLFYGGATAMTTLAESAYYRFVFWSSMAAAPVKPYIHTEHTLFSARYATDRGIRLQDSAFSRYRARLTDPRHYQACQALGAAMRAAPVDAFQYPSARADGGICVALFTPDAFACHQPHDTQSWLCETTASTITFKQKQAGQAAIIAFPVENFLVDGKLPMPA